MQLNACTCSLANLQRIGDRLDRDVLPVDKILQIGSEFLEQLQKTSACDTCAANQRVRQALSQITFRIVGFYEAAYLDVIENLSSHPSSSSSSNSSDCISSSRTSPQFRRPSNCKAVPREMRLGEMPIDGLDGRSLVRVVLVDACLELNEKIQEWKQVMEDPLAIGRQQDLTQYNAIIDRCQDRMANLIGLLRLDALSKDRF